MKAKPWLYRLSFLGAARLRTASTSPPVIRSIFVASFKKTRPQRMPLLPGLATTNKVSKNIKETTLLWEWRSVLFLLIITYCIQDNA